MNTDLIAIDCVVQIFWNYTDADIKEMRSRSDDFNYVWHHYVTGRDEEAYPTTYPLLWWLWLNKFSNDTKVMIIDYSKERYEDEKRRGYESANHLQALLKAHILKEGER